MNIKEFEKLVMQRHCTNETDIGNGVVEAVAGLTSESGELMQVIRKRLYEGLSASEAYKEIVTEAGDVLHYLMLFCIVTGLSLEDLAEVNAMKIRARNGPMKQRKNCVDCDFWDERCHFFAGKKGARCDNERMQEEADAD